MKRLFNATKETVRITVFMCLCMLLPAAGAYAITIPPTVGTAINTTIDSIQNDVVTYIVGAAMTAFFSALTWVSLKLKIKVTEYFNRNAMELAAKRYANDMIDVLQNRLIGTSSLQTIEVTDLVRSGIDYIKTGNSDAVKESKITTDRLATIVRGALNAKVEDLRKVVSQRSPS